MDPDQSQDHVSNLTPFYSFNNQEQVLPIEQLQESTISGIENLSLLNNSNVFFQSPNSTNGVGKSPFYQDLSESLNPFIFLDGNYQLSQSFEPNIKYQYSQEFFPTPPIETNNLMAPHNNVFYEQIINYTLQLDPIIKTYKKYIESHSNRFSPEIIIRKLNSLKQSFSEQFKAKTYVALLNTFFLFV